MTRCEEVRAAALRGTPPDAEVAAHVASCSSCGEERAGLALLATALAAEAEGAAAPGLVGRVLRAAEPVLEEHARAARVRSAVDWRRIGRVLAPAVLVLPVLVVLDVLLLRGAYELLATLLPAALTAYLVASYALLLAALVGLTFGAIPLLVQRQGALPWKEGHV